MECVGGWALVGNVGTAKTTNSLYIDGNMLTSQYAY